MVSVVGIKSVSVTQNHEYGIKLIHCMLAFACSNRKQIKHKRKLIRKRISKRNRETRDGDEKKCINSEPKK